MKLSEKKIKLNEKILERKIYLKMDYYFNFGYSSNVVDYG